MASLLALLLPVLLVHAATVPDRTTEQGEAQIDDPTLECTSYPYAPVTQALGQFPSIWQLADILPNDNNAQAKFQSIQSQIPNIPPNGIQPGSTTGNFSGFNYPANDPNCWWTSTQCVTPKTSGIPPDVATVPEPNTLGYGFDDGPSCSHNIFYDFLQQNNQKASLFYIGSNVLDWPLEAQRALADGHEICVRKYPPYTWSHHYMTALTNSQAFAELYYAIKLVVGVTPTCWRPPYGDIDDRIRAIAHALGLRSILWKYDSNDWSGGLPGVSNASIDANYQALISAGQSGTFNSAGTIMLTHELNNFTMQEAINFYNPLKSTFRLVPVGVAYNVTQPYVESNYGLPNFAQYISGTTTVAAPQSSPSVNQASSSNGTASSSSSSPKSSSSGAAPPYGTLGGLALSAALLSGVSTLWM